MSWMSLMKLMSFWLAFAVDDGSLGPFCFLAGFWYSTVAFPEVACASVVASSCSAILCAPMRRLFHCVDQGVFSVHEHFVKALDHCAPLNFTFIPLPHGAGPSSINFAHHVARLPASLHSPNLLICTSLVFCCILEHFVNPQFAYPANISQNECKLNANLG